MTKLSAWKMAGIVFLLCAATAIAASAQTFTTLVNFNGRNGANPFYMSLVQGADGNIYGTTENGGANSDGTIFRATLAGALTHYSFGNGNADGGIPYAGLVLATDGSFYGTTTNGGNGFGTIFKINPQGTLSTLHTFCAQPPYCADGGQPWAGLIQATDENFYGTTVEYGINHGGTVFRMTPMGVLRPLYSFCAQPNCADGESPSSPLVQASDGNFYGTTVIGGNPICGPDGCGTVFKITSSGKLTTLHSFDGTDGYYPLAGLIQATDGNLYGTTPGGGSLGNGTIFRITLTGDLTTLYTFCAQPNCADGSGPFSPLIQATDGNFYGTTSGGGANNDGTLFSITSDGVLTTLHSFDGTGPVPEGGLLQQTDGNFYGTTLQGGARCCDGTVFSLSTGLGPFLAFVHRSGKIGQTGGILGQGFTGTTGVSLNGIPAGFTVESDTFIKATVPAGATTGYVTVTTPSGVLTSNVPFNVIK
jgi:uncharacterized repeat protein (TIGR03803 family)